MRAVLALVLLSAVAASAANWTTSPFTQSVIMGISFADAKNGFIAGGDNGVGADVLSSTDGGQTFTQVPLHEPAMMLLAVATQSSESAIVAGLGVLFGGTQYTTNGTQFTNSSLPKVSMQQTQDAQRIADDSQGYVVTGVFSFFGSNASINGIALSADGGASFSFIDIGTGPSTPARYGAFPSSSVGFVSAGAWPSSRSSTLLGAKAISSRVHIHTGKDGKKMKMHLDRRTERVSADEGWTAAISRSTDGFATFQTVYTNSSFYFNQISCASEQVCYAAGENDDWGVVYKTEDGGDSWNEVMVAHGVSLMAAQAISEDEAYAAGGIVQPTDIDGHIYHTTDGGATWEMTDLPSYYLTDLEFLDADHGYATAMNTDSTCNVLLYA